MIVDFIRQRRKRCDKQKRIDCINKTTNSSLSYQMTFNKNSFFEGCIKTFGAIFLNNTFIGFGTYIGHNTKLELAKIGRYCSIANDVRIERFSHPTHFAITYPPVYTANHTLALKISPIFSFQEKKTQNNYSCEIGNDVWIGANVLIRGLL